MNNIDTSQRWYFLDWMRVLGVLQVMIVHALQFFDNHPDAFAFKLRDPSEPEIPVVEAYQLYGHAFGMPVFFIIAGAAAVLGYSSKKNVYKSICARAARLLVPLSLGLFVLIIPAKFITPETIICGDLEAPSNFFYFYFFYLARCLPHHGVWWLWFLVILFVVTSAILPLIDSSSAVLAKPTDPSTHKQSNIFLLIYSIVIFAISFVSGLPFTCALAAVIQIYVVTGLLSLKVTSNNINGKYSWLAFALSSLARGVYHLRIPAEDDFVANWLFVLVGFALPVIMGASMALYKDDFMNFIRNKKLVGIFGLITISLSLFLMGIVAGQEDPRFDYYKLNGIYVTYKGGFAEWNRLKFHLATVVLLCVILSFAVLTINDPINKAVYTFLNRSVVCVYMLHGLPQIIIASFLSNLNVPLLFEILIMISIPQIMTYCSAVLIDNVKYLRTVFGFTGKPVKIPFIKGKEKEIENQNFENPMIIVDNSK
ncbi:hypothetical protein P9112_007318 [Eukaryota sp. TZLM1-RC]